MTVIAGYDEVITNAKGRCQPQYDWTYQRDARRSAGWICASRDSGVSREKEFSFFHFH
jgi:hypothetical protein